MSGTYKIDNSTVVISELAKAFQKKYGDEALELFVPILEEYGTHAGRRLAKKMADRDFAGRVEGWLQPIIDAGLAAVVERGEDHVVITGTDCPLKLAGSNRALCDTCMSIDQGLVSELAGKEITLSIEKSLARGDDSCRVRFST